MAYIDFQLRHEVVKLKRAIVKVIIIQISQKSNIYSHNNHQPSATLLSTNTSPQSPHQVLFLLFLNGSVWLVGSFLFIHLEGSTEAAHKCGSSNHFPQIHQTCTFQSSIDTHHHQTAHQVTLIIVLNSEHDMVQCHHHWSLMASGVKRVQRNFVDELWLESQV